LIEPFIKREKESINKIRIPIRDINDSKNDGIKSLYLTRISTKRYWELIIKVIENIQIQLTYRN